MTIPNPPQSAKPNLMARLLTETPVSRLMNRLVCVFLLVLLAAEICLVTKTFSYDEPFHLSNVMLLREAGLSKTFFMGSPYSAPGPLYPIYHFLLAPLTQLRPVPTRLANAACVGWLLFFLSRILLRLRPANEPDNSETRFRYICLAFSFLMVPPDWIVSGLALTEIPSLAAAGCGILFWLKTRAQTPWTAGWWLYSLVAGFALAGSSCGRSIMLAITVSLVFVDFFERPITQILPLALPAFILPAALFVLWGGLVPAAGKAVVGSLNPLSLILCFCYTGVSLFFVNPGWFGELNRPRLVIAAAAGCVNFAVGGFKRYPYLAFNYKKYFPAAQELLGRALGSILIIFAVTFALWLMGRVWDAYREKRYVTLFFALSGMFLSISPLTIYNRWNVRYIVPALPFLIVVATPGVKLSWLRAGLGVLGGVIGFFFLHGYMFSHLKETADIVISW